MIDRWKWRCTIALAALKPTLTDEELRTVVESLKETASGLDPVEVASFAADCIPGDHIPHFG